MALSRLIQRQCNPISFAGQQPRLGKGGEATNVAEDHHDFAAVAVENAFVAAREENEMLSMGKEPLNLKLVVIERLANEHVFPLDP